MSICAVIWIRERREGWFSNWVPRYPRVPGATVRWREDEGETLEEFCSHLLPRASLIDQLNNVVFCVKFFGRKTFFFFQLINCLKVIDIQNRVPRPSDCPEWELRTSISWLRSWCSESYFLGKVYTFYLIFFLGHGFCFIVLILFFLFRAAPTAYESSQVKMELQQPAYTTATATLWILNPLSKGRDRTCVLMDTSWVLNLLSHNRNSRVWILNQFLREFPFMLTWKKHTSNPFRMKKGTLWGDMLAQGLLGWWKGVSTPKPALFLCCSFCDSCRVMREVLGGRQGQETLSPPGGIFCLWELWLCLHMPQGR